MFDDQAAGQVRGADHRGAFVSSPGEVELRVVGASGEVEDAKPGSEGRDLGESRLGLSEGACHHQPAVIAKPFQPRAEEGNAFEVHEGDAQERLLSLVETGS
jgi:hypothetical protein